VCVELTAVGDITLARIVCLAGLGLVDSRSGVRRRGHIRSEDVPKHVELVRPVRQRQTERGDELAGTEAAGRYISKRGFTGTGRPERAAYER
jgi:hypothetical protein